MTTTAAQTLRKLSAETQVLTARVVKLELQVVSWRLRNLEKARELKLARLEAKRQRDRAELWKHRALTKVPVTPARGGKPKWEDE